MSNRFFQGIVYQLKESINRTVGVIDENGSIVSCSDLIKIGETFENVIPSITASMECVVEDGYTFKPLDSKSGLEYVAFIEGTDEMAAKFVSIVAITLANTKQYFDEKYDKNNFVKNVILDNILPGDIFIKSKELHFETEAYRVAMLIRLSDKSDVSAFDILQGLFPEKQKDFIKLYGGILKVRNVLSSFDEFNGMGILSDRDIQDYHSMYISLYEQWRVINHKDKDNINDDVKFEMELIKQVEINIDYILMLIKKYQSGGHKDKEIIVNIQKSVDSSMELRSKKDLIMNFIDSLTPTSDIDADWKTYVGQQKLVELNKIIEEEKLNQNETYKFIDDCFRDGFVQSTGTAINKILPPVSLFTKNNDRGAKRATVLEKIVNFFNRFKDIVSN